MNPKNLVLLQTFFTLLSTVPAYAGWSSGGGNAQVCFDQPRIARAAQERARAGADQVLLSSDLSHIRSIEAIDLLYARHPQNAEDPRATELVPMRSGEAVSQYIDKIKARMERMIPKLAQNIEDGRQAFAGSQTQFMPNGVPFVDDASLLAPIDLRHCAMVTIARQYQSGDTYILALDQRLYTHRRHSLLSRAVLLLHEYLYRAGRNLGHENSRNTRTLLGALITQNNGMTLARLLQISADMGFTQPDYRETYYYSARIEMGEALLARLSLAFDQGKTFEEVHVEALDQLENVIYPAIDQLKTLLPIELIEQAKTDFLMSVGRTPFYGGPLINSCNVKFYSLRENYSFDPVSVLKLYGDSVHQHIAHDQVRFPLSSIEETEVRNGWSSSPRDYGAIRNITEHSLTGMLLDRNLFLERVLGYNPAPDLQDFTNLIPEIE